MKTMSPTMEQQKKPMSMHPKKFALWLFIVSIIMMFAAMTSAYIVQKGDKEWVQIDLPAVLYINTVVLLLSSFTIQWAYRSAKRDNLQPMKTALLVTTILGVLFLVGQVVAYSTLQDLGVYFGRVEGRNNVAGDFFYVLTGLHGFHLVTGLIFLLIVVVSAFRYKVHSKSMTLIEMCTTYWHFLDLLWVYLFVFLLINH